MVSAHRRIPEDRGRRLESKELVDEHVGRDSEEGKERLEENPGGLAVRADDARVGAADDRPEVESDAVLQILPSAGGDGHLGPLPTMLIKTSSKAGCDFANER